MGMKIMDSFSGYATAQVPLKFNGGASGNAQILNGGGRHGNRALTLFATSVGAIIILKVPTTNLIAGFACLNPTAPANQNSAVFFEMTPTDFLGSERAAQVAFTNATGGIRGSAGTTAADSASGLWFQSVYFHIQVRCKTTWAGGVMSCHTTIKFNNVQILDITGTVSTASNKIQEIRFVFTGGPPSIQISDFYMIDMNDGISPTDFISPTGDLDVSPLFPDAPGIQAQWTPLAAPNWSQVNETTPDGDTSYVKDSTVGDADYYHFPADTTIAPAGSVIYGVQENCFAEKDDPAGSRSFVPSLHINSSGLNYQNAEDVASLGNNYAYYYSVYPFNYGTNAPWQLGEVGGSGSQFGQKVIA